MNLNYDMTLLLLVFMRMSGCILFNPILGRKNIPNTLKIGLTLILSLFSYKLVPQQTLEIDSFLTYSLVLIKEFSLGYTIGYIVQLFLSVLILGGEVIDLQMGISMAKIYDPQSNVSMPISASFLNVMLMLLFFSTNSHLTLIKIFHHASIAFPYGKLEVNPELFKELVSMFSLILIYAVKLALPILAAELIAEIGVGIIMKAVPQINVFVVNLQLKILIGFAVMLLLVPPYANFLEKLILLMFDKINLIVAAF